MLYKTGLSTWFMIWPKILEQCLVSMVPEALSKYINISSFIFCSQCNMKGPWAQISLPSLPKFPQIHDSPVCKPLSSTFASLGWPSHRTSRIYDFSSLALVSFVVRKLPVQALGPCFVICSWYHTASSLCGFLQVCSRITFLLWLSVATSFKVKVFLCPFNAKPN